MRGDKAMTISIGGALEKKEDPRSAKESKELIDSNTYIGVEVELEGIYIKEVANMCPLLESTDDWSLRGDDAGEILFAFPLKGEDVVVALKAIETYTIQQKTRPIISSRTSTHVHIDMRNMDVDSLCKFIAVYLTIERVLFHYCGKEREDNIFCVPLYKSDTYLKYMSKVFNSTSSSAFLSHLQVFNEQSRYAALNLTSLWSHGTVELRILKGEFRSTKLIDWVNMVLSIKKYAESTTIKALSTPKQVQSEYCDEYLTTVFGKYADMLKYDGFEHDIVKGTRVAQDVLNSIRQQADPWKLLEIAQDSVVKVKDTHLINQGEELSLGKKLKAKKFKNIYSEVFEYPTQSEEEDF